MIEENSEQKKNTNLPKIMPRFYVLAVATVFLLVAVFFGGEFRYWFFNLLRFIVMASCIYAAFECKKKEEVFVFGGIALLYNPLFPIHLGDRDVWVVVNLITVAFFVFDFFVVTFGKSAKED